MSLWQAFQRSGRMFLAALPILLGVLLWVSMFLEAMPQDLSAAIFTGQPLLDAIEGATLGSIATGQPVVSYILGGELLKHGASAVAVTALVFSWVTVGVVQLPAEALMLGTRFALWRNLISYALAIAASFLTAWTLRVMP